jgi:hypothetical protein
VRKLGAVSLWWLKLSRDTVTCVILRLEAIRNGDGDGDGDGEGHFFIITKI